MRPALQRLLWVVGTAAAFVLLVALGLGLASLLGPGDSHLPDPEPERPARAARPPEPAPAPPPPAPVQQPAPVPPPPPPAPVIPEPPLHPGVLPLNAKLRVRREIVFGLTRLKDELARCPTEAVQRGPAPGARATLVLEAIGTGNAVQVTSSRLEAADPVNDRFVSCARGIIEGRTIPAAGAPAGIRLRFSIPLGPGGNSLSVSSGSLVEADASP